MDDRSSPVKAYETFRGAIARAELDREWTCLSDRLRSALGMRDRGDWADARAVVLDQDHILVRGICRSSVEGGPEVLPDGRILLKLDFPLGYEGRVVLKRAIMLRAFADGVPEPVVNEPIDRIAIRFPENGDAILVEVPRELRKYRKYIAPELEKTILRFEVVAEWFLDDFAAGDETPNSIRKNLDEKDQGP